MDQPPTPPPTSYQPQPPPPRRRGRRIGELATVSLLSAALAAGGTWGVIAVTDEGPDATGATEASATSSASSSETVPVSTGAEESPDWTAVTDAVTPSVVAVGVRGQAGGGEGSGVILDEQGHVLTNNHVVSGAGPDPQITVTLSDGATYDATIAGTDPSTDLAVLTIADPPKDIEPITVGSSTDLQVGDPVMAAGNPLGLAGTVTTGIVSALDRPVSTARSEGGQSPFAQQGRPVVTAAIQTSAAINPGNSGGALVDASGRLVGINSSIATVGGSGQSGNIGIGFAIPVDEATWIAEQLIEDGEAEHAFLGVVPADGTAKEGAATHSGAEIRSVSDGSPADEAGLAEGDLVVAIGDSRVTGAESLVGLVHARQIDSQVPLTVIRDGEKMTIDVTLGTAPERDA
ncbi:trypsin-like peptidase domain-containing protein [Janibacter cremeus]|uniref:S1C family serine protease n=1 Tax=Janibacter cremeus TaxID=1285192 RepID=UPI0023F71358|nr:trypsin-like peptidase domain-containing protein [Janibacter cremeus]WEV77767.1 trypsin-like peptidase domain-containing protein [Janibacter cremeus]